MAISRIPFGRTGHDSSRIIFGAAALGAMSQGRADATLELIAGAGVNHIDTAASYGESELRLAPWLADHRSEVFLATKTGERAGDAARAELERSLERLGADHVDLIQLHNLVESDQWEVAHGAGGVVEAMAQARDEGLVRFIGVTGHGVRIAAMHLRSLDAIDFDSVLLTCNYTMLARDDYRPAFDRLVSECAERQVAVQTIKSIAKDRWPADYDGPRFSWYRPLDEPDAIARATRWVLGQPGLFLNTTSDARKLPVILEAASNPGPSPDSDQIEADIAEHSMSAIFDGAALERI